MFRKCPIMWQVPQLFYLITKNNQEKRYEFQLKIIRISVHSSDETHGINTCTYIMCAACRFSEC
jgi:hypothetical protein